MGALLVNVLKFVSLKVMDYSFQQTFFIIAFSSIAFFIYQRWSQKYWRSASPNRHEHSKHFKTFAVFHLSPGLTIIFGSKRSGLCRLLWWYQPKLVKREIPLLAPVCCSFYSQFLCINSPKYWMSSGHCQVLKSWHWYM